MYRGALAAGVSALALVAGGCGGGVAVADLPLEERFEDCSSFTMNDDVSTVDCPDGELRILVSQPDRSPIHIVPFRFESAEPTLAVDADVRLANGKGAFGLGCAVSEPGEPGRGYLFMLLHGDPSAEGLATVTRLDWTEAEGQTLQGVRFKRRAVLSRKPHHVRGECVSASNGSTHLRMTVDGRVVVEARDEYGLGPFTAATPVLIAAAPDSDARFDGLRVDAANP